MDVNSVEKQAGMAIRLFWTTAHANSKISLQLLTIQEAAALSLL